LSTPQPEVADDTSLATDVAAQQPASAGRRAAGRGIDLLLGLAIALGGRAFWGTAGLLTATLGVSAAVLAVAGATAATPGGLLVGVRHVATGPGRAAGPATARKYLLEILVSVVTMGIGLLVAGLRAKAPQRRTVFDRWAGVMAVTATSPIGNASDDFAIAPPAAPSGLITSVGTASRPVVEPRQAATPGRTVAPRPSAAPEPASVAPGPAGPQFTSGVTPADHVIEHVPRRPRPPAVDIEQPLPGPLPARQASVPATPIDDVDDHTILDPHEALSGSSTAPRLVLDTGVELRPSGPVLLGRSPSTRAGYETAQLVSLEDPAFSISKTHLALVPVEDGFVVHDLHSTNGTGVREPGGDWRMLAPGERHEVGPGAQVRFGRRTLEVRP